MRPLCLTSRWTLVALFALSLACGKSKKSSDDDDSAAANAPAVPPVGTISMDLSVSSNGRNLDAQGVAGITEVGGAAVAALSEGIAHVQASIFVLVVDLNMAAPLTVPVALLRQAAQAVPKLVGINSYVRSFEVTSGNRKFTGNLTSGNAGSDGASRTDWTMLVTATPADANGCCSDFQFFTGISGDAGTGSWQLFDPARPKEAAKLFSISYEYKSTAGKTVTYSVNSDRPAAQKFGNGSSIVYAAAEDAITMTYKDSAESGQRVIAWSKSSKSGAMTGPQGEKKCWDTENNGFADSSCP